MTQFLNRCFVWAGGAVFVGSLGVTAWTYLRWFGEAQQWQGWLPVGQDALLVSLFATHHSAFAREGVKRALARIVPEQLLRSTYVWIASLLLLMVCALWRPVGGALYDVTGGGWWLFTIAQLAGVGIIAGSVKAIDPLDLAGIRPQRIREDLQTRGPYGLVRHPLYLGWALLVLGASRMTGDRLVFALLTTSYLVIAIPWEERSIERTFGEAYRRYKQRVRWRVLPYLY
jgi:methanethiol S-methyltransferase